MRNHKQINYKIKKEIIQNGCWNCDKCAILNLMLSEKIYFCSSKTKNKQLKKLVLNEVESIISKENHKIICKGIIPGNLYEIGFSNKKQKKKYDKYKEITFKNDEIVEKFGICNKHKLKRKIL